MFEYGEAILICPVMEHIADEEDGDALGVRRLRLEEVVGFF